MNIETLRIRAPHETEIAALPAIEADAQQRFVRTVHQECATGPTLSVEHFRERAMQGDGQVLVAEVDRQLVGFIVWCWLDGEPYIEELDMLCSHAGCGIGSRLVDALQAAVADRATVVRLTTFADVPWNAPYYARLGFRAIDERSLSPGLAKQLRKEASDGLRNRVAMQRPLKSGN